MTKKTMPSAVEAHQRVEADAKKKAHKKQPIVRRVETIAIGEFVRQGDIYVHRVPDRHAHGKLAQSRKLAMGETMGSRHIAEAPAQVFVGTTLPEGGEAGTFLGPCVVATERLLVTHPEHDHYDLPPGTYQITHQTDTLTRERVRD